jgi:hypothetical protein
MTPITVTLKEGKHKTQPWTFVIDRPGAQSKETKQERYATMTTAKRGAARVLATGNLYRHWNDVLFLGGIWDPKLKKKRPVVFIVERLPKKRK